MVLARPDPELNDDELLIDSWLMSCRVLGRQVESAVLEVLGRAARQAGYRALVGQYRRTERNAMVAEHYPNLGFEQHPLVHDSEPDASYWRYDLGKPFSTRHFIEVIQP